MPIDTSSYYPEVPGRDGAGYSLNDRSGGLFGPERKPDPEPEPTPEPERSPEPAPVPKPDDSDPGDTVRFMDGVSNFLSWILVPLLMPVYGLILAFGLSILDIAPMGLRVAFTSIVFAIDVVLPMIVILVLKRFNVISDLGLNGRKERLLPYIMMVVCYGATAWFMAAKGAPLWLSMFFAGGALAGVINLFVNFWWKISAHAAGIAGVVALLIRIERNGSPEPQLFFWLILTIALAGLVGSARVWLGRHTVWQVLAGYAVGFCSVFFLTMIH